MEKDHQVADGVKSRIVEFRSFEHSSRPVYPRNMLIELTNACNNKCIFCVSPKMTRKISRLDEGTLFRILEEAYALGTREVGFYSTGEPFLSKKLHEYVAKAKSTGYEYIYITSNGILATPDRSIPAIDAGLNSIKFSINAGSRETYKLVHGTDNFDKIIDNLRVISNYRKEHNLPLKLYASYVVTRQSKDECGAFKELVGSLVDEILFVNVQNQGGMMFEINDHMSVGTDEFTAIEPPCSMVFNRFHITSEGYLTSCCIDYQNYLAMADLNVTSLKDAWHNALFTELREKHLTNKLEGTLCYNCLNNKNTKIKPLVPQFATDFDPQSFVKSQFPLSK